VLLRGHDRRAGHRFLWRIQARGMHTAPLAAQRRRGTMGGGCRIAASVHSHPAAGRGKGGNT
jgi:hypothetical protein